MMIFELNHRVTIGEVFEHFGRNLRKVPNFGSKMRKNAKIALKKRIFMNIGCVALATALFSAPNWLHFVSVPLKSHFRSYFGNFKNLPRAPQKWQNSTLKFFSSQ